MPGFEFTFFSDRCVNLRNSGVYCLYYTDFILCAYRGILAKTGHEVTDVEVGDIAHVVGAQTGSVQITEQGMILMYVDAFNMVHGDILI